MVETDEAQTVNLEHVVDGLVARTGGTYHRHQLRSLAHEKYAQLAHGAKLTNYLPILAERAVLEYLRSPEAAAEMSMADQPIVLVVDAHNTTRSQSAAALLRYYAPGRYRVTSAGVAAGGFVNPAIPEVLGEIGLELSEEPQTIAPEMLADADFVILIDEEPGTLLPDLQSVSGEVISWSVPEPTADDRADLERVLGQIDGSVRSFLLELEPDHALAAAVVA